MNEKGDKLRLFRLIDDTCAKLKEDKLLYIDAISDITQKLESILNENDGVMDINARIKSPFSLKEKIIRKKIYHQFTTAEDILDNLSDVIGIRIDCRFLANEHKIYDILKKHFCIKNDLGFYHDSDNPRIIFDLGSKQPQIQKNGYEVYKIDGHCFVGGKKINFELQIKSLVNEFWSDIEHKVVYKNNVYIPNHGYIEEMLTAIRGNLIGIDKMLKLVNDEIQDTTSDKRGNLIDINSAITKLISDTFVAKMSESIGFTVDFKAICNLIGKYILNKYKDLPVRTAHNTFLDLVDRFNEIYHRKINWENKLYLEEEYVDDDPFCQIFGDKLLSIMNTDFEWHLFFLILFQIESDNNNLESFREFMSNMKNSYSDKSLYNRLYFVYDEHTADKIHEKLTTFLAYALSASADVNIIDSESEEYTELIDGVIEYVISNFRTYDEFEDNLDTVHKLFFK